MAAVLYVRLKSSLDQAELDRRMLERFPRFREVPGLVQKVYGREAGTGYYCGIYFFDSAEALERYVDSELARTIPSAYEVVDIRKEIYDVLFPLWPDRGPLVEIEPA